ARPRRARWTRCLRWRRVWWPPRAVRPGGCAGTRGARRTARWGPGQRPAGEGGRACRGPPTCSRPPGPLGPPGPAHRDGRVIRVSEVAPGGGVRVSEANGPVIEQTSTRVVYQTPHMRLREDGIRRPDGSTGIYSYVEKPDFALIIPAENGG